MDPKAHSGPIEGSGSTWTLDNVAARYRRHRFAALFVTLLLTLGVGGTLEALIPRLNPLQWLLGLNLVAAIASVIHEGAIRALVALGVIFVVTRGVLAVFGMPGMLSVSDGAWVMAIAMATTAAVRHAFGQGIVDRERIFAALDAYLLVGLLFGVAYSVLDRHWPGSFRHPTPDASLDLPQAMYFSFVTIATLGYGDVTPASPPAQGLATVEGISGQMYLAVLVARLVGLYARDPHH